MSNETRIAWSTNDEDFNYDSLSELIDYHDLSVGDVVYFGEVFDINTNFVDVDDVIEMIGNRAYDIGGENAEDFPEVSKDAAEELSAFLSEWQAKYCKPHFYGIRNSKPHKITEDDFA